MLTFCYCFFTPPSPCYYYFSFVFPCFSSYFIFLYLIIIIIFIVLPEFIQYHQLKEKNYINVKNIMYNVNISTLPLYYILLCIMSKNEKVWNIKWEYKKKTIDKRIISESFRDAVFEKSKKWRLGGCLELKWKASSFRTWKCTFVAFLHLENKETKNILA